MEYVALVVYQWGDREQDQLLAGCIGPAALKLLNAGLIDRFWFDRFDARGPHVYLVYRVAANDQKKTVEDALTASLKEYLAVNSSQVHLSPESLKEIHEACQDKALCEADRLLGTGTNNTFNFHGHSEYGYPLSLARPGAAADELWTCFTDLSKWSMAELIQRSNGASIHGPALRFVYALDRELRHEPEWASCFWRYAASTLLHTLRDDRFMVAETCLAILPPWIGQRNLENFEKTWSFLEHSGDLFTTLPNLVTLARREGDRDRFSEFGLLREVLHCGLAQLGLPVRLRAPLLLFAMLRSIKQGWDTTEG